MPGILAGFRISASVALLLVVAAEMIGAQYGIGAFVLTAGNLMQTDQLLAGVVDAVDPGPADLLGAGRGRALGAAMALSDGRRSNEQTCCVRIVRRLPCSREPRWPAAPPPRPIPTSRSPSIVPFAAGGPTDLMARIVGERMAKELGQQFIIDNITGAAGTIAIGKLARAAPDGYTIGIGHVGTHVANGMIYKNLNYNLLTDLEPIARLPANPHAGGDLQAGAGQGPQGAGRLPEGQRRQDPRRHRRHGSGSHAVHGVHRHAMPIVLGHEGSAVVEEVEGVTGVKPRPPRRLLVAAVLRLVHRRHEPQYGSHEQTTWSPGLTPVTPSPTSSTTAEPSWPSTIGIAWRWTPWTACESERQTPEAAIRIATSPVLGGSRSSSSMRRSSTSQSTAARMRGVSRTPRPVAGRGVQHMDQARATPAHFATSPPPAAAIGPRRGRRRTAPVPSTTAMTFQLASCCAHSRSVSVPPPLGSRLRLTTCSRRRRG